MQGGNINTWSLVDPVALEEGQEAELQDKTRKESDS